jgi:hypothetical protein
MFPIDPMSPEAQDMMEEFAEEIVRHAKLAIREKKMLLRELNNFGDEDY